MTTPRVREAGGWVELTFGPGSSNPFATKMTKQEAQELVSKLLPVMGVSSYSWGKQPPLVTMPVPQAPPKGSQTTPWVHVESKLGSVYVQTRHIESVVDGGAGVVHVRMLGGNIHVVEGTTADQFMQELFKGVQP